MLSVIFDFAHRSESWNHGVVFYFNVFAEFFEEYNFRIGQSRGMILATHPSGFSWQWILIIHWTLFIMAMIFSLNDKAFEWLVKFIFVGVELNETNDEIRHLNFILVGQRVRDFHALRCGDEPLHWPIPHSWREIGPHVSFNRLFWGGIAF